MSNKKSVEQPERVNMGELNGSTVEEYEPRNILITGGAGFIASHVVLRLVKRYGHYKVRVIGTWKVWNDDSLLK